MAQCGLKPHKTEPPENPRTGKYYLTHPPTHKTCTSGPVFPIHSSLIPSVDPDLHPFLSPLPPPTSPRHMLPIPRKTRAFSRSRHQLNKYFPCLAFSSGPHLMRWHPSWPHKPRLSACFYTSMTLADHASTSKAESF